MADRLLIADDERDITDMLARFFRERGYEVIPAYSGAEAVRAAGVLQYIPGTALEFTVEYPRYGAIEAFVRTSAQVDALDFAEAVHIRVLVEDAAADAFCAQIVERTDGRCTPQRCGTGYLIRPKAGES